MSTFGNIIKNTADTIKTSVKTGLSRGIEASMLGGLFGNNNQTLGEVDYQAMSLMDDDVESDILNTISAKTSKYSTSSQVSLETLHSQNNKFNSKSGELVEYDSDDSNDDISKGRGRYVNKETDHYFINIPSWGYSDYINERNLWIRHLSNGLDEQNWLYFRVFFDFDTLHGLFGGILNARDILESDRYSINSAYKYLCTLNQNYYNNENIEARKKSLNVFVKTLSAINTLTPWMFKSVSNLNNTLNPNLNDVSKEKSINIELNPDTIDFRLTTMLSAYKYACYDDFNNKEIIPENLRKFDMTVVLFSLPIKYIHTPVINDRTGRKYRANYKSGFSTNLNNIMSMKVLSFYNCEIDKESLGGYIPGSLTNDSPYQLGKNSIKITYDRVLETTVNEYDQLIINPMGFWDYKLSGESTLDLLAEIRSDMDKGEVLLTASEAYITYKLNESFGNKNFVLGNIYGQNTKVYKSDVNKSPDKYGTNSLTDYFKEKVSMLKNLNSYNNSKTKILGVQMPF